MQQENKDKQTKLQQSSIASVSSLRSQSTLVGAQRGPSPRSQRRSFNKKDAVDVLITERADELPQLPPIVLIAKQQMDAFRKANPAFFYKIYPVAEQYQALDSDEWYDHLPDDVMSHPCVARARARRRRRRKGGQETSDSRG